MSQQSNIYRIICNIGVCRKCLKDLHIPIRKHVSESLIVTQDDVTKPIFIAKMVASQLASPFAAHRMVNIFTHDLMTKTE